LYLSRVAGEFPEESEDTLFPLAVISACFDLYRKVKDLPRCPDGTGDLGLDVARMGGDRTEAYGSDWCLYEGRRIKRVRNVLSLAYTDHYNTRMKIAGLWKANGYRKGKIDAGGEGSGLADEICRMGEKFSVERVLFGSNPQDPNYFNARAEMYWQLSLVMKTGNYALEPDDDLEEELSVTGGMRDYKEKMVAHKKQLVFWLPPKEEIKLRLLRSPDKADGLALENYRGRSMGLVDLWREIAEEKNKPKIPEHPTEKSLADAQKEALEKAGDSRFARTAKSNAAVAAIAVIPEVCPDCGFGIASTNYGWFCNNCGKSERTGE
jgi:hypothetical protein